MTKGGKRLSYVTCGLVACAVLLTVSTVKAEETGRSTWGGASLDDRDVGDTPIMFSLFTPAEIPWWRPAWDVSGVRFCLPYGRCRNFSGLDVGVVTHAVSSYGIQCSAVNIVDDDVRMTLSVGGLVNVVGGAYTGFQIGGLANVVDDDVHALQIGGLANVVGGSFTGLQIGFANVVPTQAKNAWQIGFWNYGGDFDHCGQIGIFNYVRDMSAGLQIGLINIIEHNEFPCLPIVNGHF